MTKNNDYVSEEYCIVWLNETDKCGLEDIRTTLQAIIFHNRDECVDYITIFNDSKILLIISSDNAQEILEVTHTLEQIKAIYVLNSKEENDKDWANQYGKVRVIVSEKADYEE